MVRTSITSLLLALLVVIVGCKAKGPATATFGASGPQYISVNGTSVGVTPALQFPSCDAGYAYGPLDGGEGLGCVGAGAGLVTNVNPPGQVQDLNSLVWGDPSQQEWSSQGPFAGFYPSVQPNAAVGPDGYSDAVWVNPTASLATWYLTQQFSGLSTVTAVNLQADVKLPSGVSSATINLLFSQGSNFGLTACTVTSSWQTCQTGPQTIPTAPGIVNAVVQGTGTAQVLISRIRVIPTTTSLSVLAQPFVRYNASSRLLWDNSHDEMISILGGAIMRVETPYSRFVFDTNAPQIGVQLYTSQSETPYGNASVFVNGRPWCTITGAYDEYDIQLCTLPTPAGLNHVEVTTGAVQVSSTTAEPPYTAFDGDIIQGVFAQHGYVFNVVSPAKPNDRILLIGDSKEGGFEASNPPITGFDAVLRRIIPGASLAVEAWGSLSLFQISNTSTLTSSQIARYAQYQPTKIVMVLGRNDWALTTYSSVTNFGTAYAAFVNAMHATIPSAAMYVETWWLESPAEEATTNGNGETNSQYRSAVQTYAGTQSWITFINGGSIPGWNTTTMLAPDGVHPNDLGSSFAADFELAQIY